MVAATQPADTLPPEDAAYAAGLQVAAIAAGGGVLVTLLSEVTDPSDEVHGPQASRTCPSRRTTGGSTDQGKLIH